MNKQNKNKITIIIVMNILVLPFIGVILYLRKREFGHSEVISLIIITIVVIIATIYLINKIRKKTP